MKKKMPKSVCKDGCTNGAIITLDTQENFLKGEYL